MKGWQAGLPATATAMLLNARGGGSDFAEESAATILDESEKDMKALSSVTVGGGLCDLDQLSG